MGTEEVGASATLSRLQSQFDSGRSRLEWSQEEIAWMAGLLEGEGSFMKPAPSKPTLPVLSVGMSDEDVIARVARLWGVRYHRRKDRRPDWKTDQFSVRASGARAVEIMLLVWPLMGQRRRGQIAEAISLYRDRSRKLSASDEAEIAKRIDAGDVHRMIAADFGVSRSAISNFAMKRRRSVS